MGKGYSRRMMARLDGPPGRSRKADPLRPTWRPQGFSIPAVDAWGARTITSKLTSKAQTTIPQAVRTALGVKARRRNRLRHCGRTRSPDQGGQASPRRCTSEPSFASSAARSGAQRRQGECMRPAIEPRKNRIGAGAVVMSGRRDESTRRRERASGPRCHAREKRASRSWPPSLVAGSSLGGGSPRLRSGPPLSRG